VTTSIYYEQPLNERVRTFLRLEHLFARAHYAQQGNSMWDSRAVLDCLFEIQHVFGRSDLRSELLKELERHSSNFTKLEQNPNVDNTTLNAILNEIDILIDRLHALDGQPGHSLRDNEFLSSIKQRSSIAGGNCDFDLPAYHQWLLYPDEIRQQDVASWLSEYTTVSDAIKLILKLVRESAPPKALIAETGFYQQSLDTSVHYQLIRVALPAEHICFAEISAGKHRFTIRFMQMPDKQQRPFQSKEDINFYLSCCVL